MENVYHNGEKAIQELLGESENAVRFGRGIKPTLTGKAMHFIQKQLIALVSSTDEKAQLWASILIGDLGFIKVPTAQKIVFNEKLIRSTLTDILYQNIEKKPEIGTLFVELHTRRRYRVNGKVARKNGKMELAIEQMYANCPKFIQRNDLSLPKEKVVLQPKITKGKALAETAKKWISQANAFFIATKNAANQTDTSYRGGNDGFIEILPNDTLRVPDYPGNSHYSTFGNIYENPHAGLLFVDFEKGRTLQLTGKVTFDFNQNSPADMAKSADTGRFWLFETKEWILTENHHQVDWAFMDYSPYNP